MKKNSSALLKNNSLPKAFISLFLLVSLVSCKYIANKEKKEYLAKCGEDYLYAAEVFANIPQEISSDDSIQLVRSYVDNWIRTKLIKNEIYENESFKEESIQKQLEQLKYQLALHQYRTDYLNERLDTTITEAEVQTYYKEHKDDFQLRNKIVKAIFVKFPKDVPKSEDILKMMSSKDEDAVDEFRNYCYQFADNYHLNDSSWVAYNELTDATPFKKNITNEIQFLREKRTRTESDSSYLYYLSIKEYKLDQEISPYSFVKSKIKNIIINKRKTDLINNIEEEIYSNAIKNKKFEVYY